MGSCARSHSSNEFYINRVEERVSCYRSEASCVEAERRELCFSSLVGLSGLKMDEETNSWIKHDKVGKTVKADSKGYHFSTI